MSRQSEIMAYIQAKKTMFSLNDICKDKKLQLYAPSQVGVIAQLVFMRHAAKKDVDILTRNLITCAVSLFYCYPDAIIWNNKRNAKLVEELCHALNKSISTVRRYKSIVPTLYWSDKGFRRVVDEYIDYVDEYLN